MNNSDLKTPAHNVGQNADPSRLKRIPAAGGAESGLKTKTGNPDTKDQERDTSSRYPYIAR